MYCSTLCVAGRISQRKRIGKYNKNSDRGWGCVDTGRIRAPDIATGRMGMLMLTSPCFQTHASSPEPKVL